LIAGVLIPLFGLHNFLSAFKPDDENSGKRIAVEMVSAITISYQVTIALNYILAEKLA
jgi:hypothetical protein